MNSKIFDLVRDRLVRELKRVGPEAAAERVGVSLATVYNWMKGANTPLNKLMQLEDAGVDVAFVLTGQRSQGTAEIELLPSDERVLVDAYRCCNSDARRNLIQTAALLSAGMPSGAAPTPPLKMTNKAAGSIQVGSQSGGKNQVINKKRG